MGDFAKNTVTRVCHKDYKSGGGFSNANMDLFFLAVLAPPHLLRID